MFYFVLNNKILNRDEPEICYPSKPTAYPCEISYIEKDQDIEDFVENFELIDHELLLENHIDTRMNGMYESGLRIGRIFGMRIFVESHEP